MRIIFVRFEKSILYYFIMRFFFLTKINFFRNNIKGLNTEKKKFNIEFIIINNQNI